MMSAVIAAALCVYFALMYIWTQYELDKTRPPRDSLGRFMRA